MTWAKMSRRGVLQEVLTLLMAFVRAQHAQSEFLDCGGHAGDREPDDVLFEQFDEYGRVVLAVRQRIRRWQSASYYYRQVVNRAGQEL